MCEWARRGIHTVFTVAQVPEGPQGRILFHRRRKYPGLREREREETNELRFVVAVSLL